MKALQVTIPIQAPDHEEWRALLREAALTAAREESKWKDPDQAAAYLGMSRRTFDRYRHEWGLPVAELSEGTKRYHRDDLDAVLAARIVTDGEQVIEFPSLKLREIALQKGAA